MFFYYCYYCYYCYSYCRCLYLKIHNKGGAGSKTGTTALPPCSGHGRCKSMGYIASNFDGYNLVRPPVV